MTLQTTSPPFSARPSMLGYLYQCRYALLAAIQRGRNALPDLAIALENIDDVQFESNGSVIELLQTKFQVRATASLTSNCSELWKTLRIWSEGIRCGRYDAESCVLNLVTLGHAPPDSPGYYLRQDDKRDEKKALVLLTKAASNPDIHHTNAKAYTEFNSLNFSQQTALLESIVVCDQSQNMAQVEADIEKELWFYAPEARRRSMRESLEGWWFGRAIRQMSDESMTSRIDIGEMRLKIDAISSQYGLDALPDDYSTAEPDLPINPDTDTRTFVRQLRAIQISNGRIVHAIKDHWRAASQWSRWTRDLRILPEDHNAYNLKLMDEWNREFLATIEELGGIEDSEAIKMGRSLFNTLQNKGMPFRDFSQEFIWRGSYHELADGRPKIGWHPKWSDLFTNHQKS